MISIIISIIATVISLIGTIFIPVFRNEYEMKKDIQNKINLLNFVKADITALEENADNIRPLIISQILGEVRILNNDVVRGYKSNPNFLEISNAFSEFISLLSEEPYYFLIDIPSNFFADFDNYISKEIGSISLDISEKVVRFYYLAKTFYNTSKNYVEDLENLKKQGESLKNLADSDKLRLWGRWLDEINPHLLSLKDLYEKVKKERTELSKALDAEEKRLGQEKEKISFRSAFKYTYIP